MLDTAHVTLVKDCINETVREEYKIKSVLEHLQSLSFSINDQL